MASLLRMKPKASICIASYLFAYLGIPIIASQMTHLTVVTVIVLVYLFLLVPFGILRLMDFYRMNDGTTSFTRMEVTLSPDEQEESGREENEDWNTPLR